MQLKRLRLVACVGKKLDRPAPARDLYCSTWFQLARAVVDVEGEPWAILSARHGLVWPETIIAPYNETLVGQPKPAKRLWAEGVRQSLPAADEYEFLAGRSYWEFLAPNLNAKLPLRGLGIGQQQAWFKANRRVA